MSGMTTSDMHFKPDVKDCPGCLLIHNEYCERTNLQGYAYYKRVAWPFTFRIRVREVGWQWEVEGLGAEKKRVVNHTGDPLRDAMQAVEEAQIAAGDLTRQLLAFTEYKDYDDR